MDKTLGRMARKKERTIQTIVEVSMKLFKKEGVEEVTMEAIAETADIAKGTLYNYFGSKEAIIGEYMKRMFMSESNKYMEVLNSAQDTRERLFVILKRLTGNIVQHDEIFERYIMYRMSQMITFKENETHASGFGNISKLIIDKGIAEGTLKEGMGHVLCDFFDFIFIELVKEQYTKGRVDDEKINMYIDLFINGCGK